MRVFFKQIYFSSYQLCYTQFCVYLGSKYAPSSILMFPTVREKRKSLNRIKWIANVILLFKLFTGIGFRAALIEWKVGQSNEYMALNVKQMPGM